MFCDPPRSHVSVGPDWTLPPCVTLSRISPTMWKKTGSLPWFSTKNLTCWSVSTNRSCDWYCSRSAEFHGWATKMFLPGSSLTRLLCVSFGTYANCIPFTTVCVFWWANIACWSNVPESVR